MKQLRLLLTALFLLMATWANADDAHGTYTYLQDATVNGVTYRLYRVEGHYQGAYISIDNDDVARVARIKSLAGVTTSKLVIPEEIYEADIAYTVEGISQNYERTNNTTITSLTFKGPLGVSIIGMKIGSYGYFTYNLSDFTGEDDGVNFDKMSLPNLKELYIPDLTVDGTASTWTFNNYVKLTDVYFGDCRPTLSSGMFTRASNITIHMPYYYINDNLQNASVWCNFKAIVPYYLRYIAKLLNSSSGEAGFYSLGTNDYIDDTSGSYIARIGSYSDNSCYFLTGENYLVTINYDPATRDRPTLTRNGETVTTFDIDAQTVAYQETNVQEDIKYVVVDNYKQCRLSFQAGTAYVAGTYTVKSSGKTVKGNIRDKFIDCDYGSKVTLSMPATPYLLANSLKLTKYGSSTTTQSLSLPTPEEGNYTITFNVPEVNSARFNYSYIIPATVEEDPVITIIRMGEGEVKFKKFWDWRDQDDAYNTYQTVNCQQGKTQTTIPYPSPSTEGWGFTIEMTPLKGQTLRSFMLGYIMKGDNGGKDRIHWGDYLSTAQHNAETNTYTFTIDMMNGGGDDFDMTDYDIILDMGPEHTIIEEGNKQTFLRRGGTGQVYVNYEENESEYDSHMEVGTTMITIPDYDNGCGYAVLYIDKVRGEKFTAYRDGVDVTSQFTLNESQTQYHYDFDSADKQDNHRESSVWTLVFEKDENVVTSYDWTIMCAQGIEGNLISTYTAAPMTDPISDALRTYTINEANLQSVTLSITAEEDMPLLFMCDGENVSSQATYDATTQAYTLTIPAMDMLSHTWYIDFDMAAIATAATTWTVLQTEGITGAEVIVTRDGASNTTALTELSTQVIVNNAESATLKVPGEVALLYDVYLTGYDQDQKTALIKAVRAVTGLGLSEAKALVDAVTATTPQLLKERVSLTEAQEIKQSIEAVGGTVELRVVGVDTGSGSPVRVLRDGVDVTATGEAVDGYITFTVSASDLTSQTWVIFAESDLDRYDCNRDGHITIADVTKLVNKILGK
jgi:ribosomal protein L7/L12